MTFSRAFARCGFVASTLAITTFLLFFSSPAAAQAIEDPSRLSGSWYDPNRDGEGFHVQVLPNGQALVIWFTYPGNSDPGASRQAWILGTGTINGNVITITGALKARGPVFGEAYDKDDLVYINWGDLTFTFSDLNTLMVDYDGVDGSGSLNMVRISAIANPAMVSTLPPQVSGAWYDPDTDGQGWFVEILSPTQALVYFFTYDENGNQAWHLNVGKIVGRRIIIGQTLAGTGTRFGTAFSAGDVSLDASGSIALDFESCDSGRVYYYSTNEEATGSLPMIRLSSLDGYRCTGSLPDPSTDQMTLMTNPSDPVVERYSGLGGTLIDYFGSSDLDGNNLESSGALATLADGKQVRMRFDDQAGEYELVHEDSGTAYRFRQDGSGDRVLTVVQANGLVATQPLSSGESTPAQSGQPMSAPNAQAPVNLPHAGATDSGQLASVQVNHCERPSDKAHVDLVIGDSSEPAGNPTSDAFAGVFAMTVPATLAGEADNPVYEARIPVDLPEFQPLELGPRCSVLPETWEGGCRAMYVNQGSPGLAASYCADVVADLYGADPFSPGSWTQCFETEAAMQEFCAWYEFRDIVVCADAIGSATTLFRLPREDFWSKTLLNGVTEEPVFYGPTPINLEAEEYPLQEIDLGGDHPAIVDAYTQPLKVAYGTSYTGVIGTTCVEEGVQLTARRAQSNDEFTCSVDEDGWCEFNISPAGDLRSADVFDIIGPSGLETSLSVKLLLPGISLTGSWNFEVLDLESDCDLNEDPERFTATLTQEGSSVSACAVGLCLDGIFDGQTLSLSGSYDDGAGEVSTSFLLSLSPEGNTLEGFEYWSYTDSESSCDELRRVTATRQ